ncbi:SGNH/GDSL hydrolase family protein [Actinospica sp.]|uniref:SGNH/GDSL hydrolase family protein n=1 Tax=Actinospica sp. TaxID=1872142 RepID=UPI002CDFE06F|nr:SGNH/GDSL hydrolase family protein [Actinospica sp.]HWG28211.1 SGNH/GDSL hydrolase family protein [Actinospica sp.]
MTDEMGAVRTFVAVGDSFTEGLADDPGDGVYRGWADLVARRLAALEPDLTYANLAVRGKLIGQIVADQLDLAAAMRPDLASIAGGLNDAMRPGCDVEAVCALIEKCAQVLSESSGRLVMFRAIDFTKRMPSARRFQAKADLINAFVDQTAEKYGAAVVDLHSARVFDDPRLWAVDRIHLNDEGHRRVAEAVLEALGHEPAFGWRALLPPARKPWPGARTWSDLRWLLTFLLPWIRRRLTGTSSGDGVLPKRPELTRVL